MIVAGTAFAPGVVASGTAAEKLNTLSPAVTSPFVASSKNCCVGVPLIEVRSPLTARPVLAGPVPGVTATVSSVEPPAVTVDGLEAPTPEGLVESVETQLESLFCGLFGVTIAKSAELSSVSWPFPEAPPGLRS